MKVDIWLQGNIGVKFSLFGASFIALHCDLKLSNLILIVTCLQRNIWEELTNSCAHTYL